MPQSLNNPIGVERRQEMPRVGLFVTCLVDLFRPSVGLAAARLIEEAGCRVEVPMAQACCGQPAFASGDMADARAAAEAAIAAFEDFDHVVAPSSACAGILSNHYPALFRGDPAWEMRAKTFAGKVHELTGFLVDILGMNAVAAERDTTATYHDACSGFGEPAIKDQPRTLLASVKGLTLIEMHDADACCGFGGAICAKYPDLAKAKAGQKVQAIAASGAEMLIAGDLGCLMKIAGKLKREGSAVEVRHVAEVLAGMNDDPPIGGRRAGHMREAPTESVA